MSKRLVKHKKKLLLSVTIVVGVIVGLFWWMVIGDGLVQQIKMGNYLKEKYGQEFVVTNAEYKNSGLGVKGVWEAEAYPKDDSTLKFRVGASEYNFSDQFVAAIWSRELTPELVQYVREIYKNEVSALVRVVLSDDLAKNAMPMSPELSDAKKYEYGFLYEINIINKAGKDVVEEASRATRLVNKIKSTGVKNITLKYDIESEKLRSKCVIFPSELNLSSENDIKDCIENGRL